MDLPARVKDLKEPNDLRCAQAYGTLCSYGNRLSKITRTSGGLRCSITLTILDKSDPVEIPHGPDNPNNFENRND